MTFYSKSTWKLQCLHLDKTLLPLCFWDNRELPEAPFSGAGSWFSQIGYNDSYLHGSEPSGSLHPAFAGQFVT